MTAHKGAAILKKAVQKVKQKLFVVTTKIFVLVTGRLPIENVPRLFSLRQLRHDALRTS